MAALSSVISNLHCPPPLQSWTRSSPAQCRTPCPRHGCQTAASQWQRDRSRDVQHHARLTHHKIFRAAVPTSSSETDRTTTAGDYPVRKGYVETRGGQIHYRQAGPSTGWPLILLHQNPESSACWERVLPLFAKRGFFSVAFDLPCRGASFVLKEEPKHISEVADPIWEAIQGLGVKGSMAFIGHHGGSAVAMWLAHKHPDSVRRLALFGIPAFTGERRERLATLFDPPLETENAEFLVKMWQFASTNFANVTFDQKREVLIGLLQAVPTRSWIVKAVLQTDIEDLASKIVQPVLAFTSDKDVLIEETKAAASRMQNARIHFVEGQGVDMQAAAPEQFVELTAPFLLE